MRIYHRRTPSKIKEDTQTVMNYIENNNKALREELIRELDLSARIIVNTLRNLTKKGILRTKYLSADTRYRWYKISSMSPMESEIYQYIISNGKMTRKTILDRGMFANTTLDHCLKKLIIRGLIKKFPNLNNPMWAYYGVISG